MASKPGRRNRLRCCQTGTSRFTTTFGSTLKGGLGDIYRARDIELSREVALKRIRLKYSSESRVRRRFLREARLTARLNHPGVVPIHGLIWDRQGQPWYVMRFVEGKTLALAIDEYHKSLQTGNRLDDQTLVFRKLLARFVAVCDTIAFAHSRDVVHRDLKPSNVILGEYGETIVLDWGLATSAFAGPDDPTSPQPKPPTAEEGEPVTHAGQVLGTPAFMSPEQAKGLPAMNRPASDIYGLGAILYTILAGRAPFQPEGWASLREKIVQGDYPSPREIKADLPRALEAIRRKAMALEPADRYDTAGALARDVERWSADEPVSAWREPWTRRARSWTRKHRTALATTASAAIVAALLLGTIAGFRISERRKTDALARSMLGQSDGLAIEARTSGELATWSQAIAEALRAVERLESGGGSPALRRELDTRLVTFRAEQSLRQAALAAEKKDRQIVADLDEARIRSVYAKDGGFDLKAKHEAYLAAFRAYGIDLVTLPLEDAAKRIRDSEVVDHLISALDDWATSKSLTVPQTRLVAIARASDDDPERVAIRDAISRGDVTRLRRLCEREEDRRELGPRLRSVFEALLRIDPDGSFTTLEAIRREHPSDFWLHHNLGWAFQSAKVPQHSEAVRCLSVAVALRPDSAGAHNNFGVVLSKKGDLDGAIAEYRIASRIQPEYAQAHSNIGMALSNKGDLGGAIDEYRTAIRIKPEFAEAHSNLGNALRAKGDLNGAIAEYQTAIRFNAESSEAHDNLGVVLSDNGDPDGALREHRIAIRIQPEYPEAHYNLGGELKARGDLEGAIAEYRTAIRYKAEYVEAHNNLGAVLAMKNDFAGATVEYRIALRINTGFALAHNNLGVALKAKGDFEGAIREHRIAIQIQPENAEAHDNLGIVLKAEGDLEGAIDEHRTAIRIQPEFALAHNNLGVALKAKGDFEGSIREYRTAIRINPNYALTHTNLGNALVVKGDFNAAIDEHRTAIRINPNFAEAHSNLGNALAVSGDLEGAISEHNTAIRINPQYPDAHYNLGNVLRIKGDFEAAIDECRIVIRLKPDLAEAHSLLGVCLSAKANLNEAISEYRIAIGLKPNLAEPHLNLGNALSDLGHLKDAITEYRISIRLNSQYAEAYCHLGLTKQRLGFFAEALGHLERGHELGSKRPDWRYPSAQWIRECRRIVELDGKLLAILKGELSPGDAEERLILANLCLQKKLNAGSTRFFGEAFTERPALTANPQSGFRYNAACAASLAASGQGKDEPMPDNPARAKLREQALGWLRADLVAWTKVLNGSNEPARKQTVARTLAHWQQDADLTCIRDEVGLKKLPDEEQKRFRSLWLDVENLRKTAEAGGGS